MYALEFRQKIDIPLHQICEFVQQPRSITRRAVLSPGRLEGFTSGGYCEIYVGLFTV